MSFAIFRVEGIKNTGAFRGLNKHNQERISETNPDIDHEKSKDNFDLVSCPGTYTEKFNKIVEPYHLEHTQRMKTMRADRKVSFEKYINGGKNNVACDMIFTSDRKFFEGMSRADIQKWAETSLEFVTQDIGIPKENIIHATVHLDETTPHMHVVCVPLLRSYDNRAKCERWSINQNKFIGNRINLSTLQDKYYSKLKDQGYNLERGQKGTLKKHKETVDFKREHLQALENGLDKAEKVNLDILDAYQNIAPKKSFIGHNITITEEEYEAMYSLATAGGRELRDSLNIKLKLKESNDKIKELTELIERYEKSLASSKETIEKYKAMAEEGVEYKNSYLKLRKTADLVNAASENLGLDETLLNEMSRIRKEQETKNNDVR